MASLKTLIFVFAALFAVALAEDGERIKKAVAVGYSGLGFGYGGYPGYGYSGYPYYGYGAGVAKVAYAPHTGYGYGYNYPGYGGYAYGGYPGYYGGYVH